MAVLLLWALNYYFIKRLVLELEQEDSGRALALSMANPHSILGTLYGLLSTTRGDPKSITRGKHSILLDVAPKLKQKRNVDFERRQLANEMTKANSYAEELEKISVCSMDNASVCLPAGPMAAICLPPWLHECYPSVHHSPMDTVYPLTNPMGVLCLSIHGLMAAVCLSTLAP